MEIDELRTFCLSLPGTSEGLPFGPEPLVFKVLGKMFALADLEPFHEVTLKCAPDKAQELREQYSAIKPGYHMDKRHWNTIELDGSIPEATLYQWVRDSYDLVVAKLPRREQRRLQSV